MEFSLIADCYEKIESTTKRLEMTQYLVELFKITPAEMVDKVVYLTQGKLYPDFVDVQTGIAEKLAIQVVGKATGRSERDIRGELAKTGDIGETVQGFMTRKAQSTLFDGASLTVKTVYDQLDKAARAAGSGSMERKLSLLAGLLTSASPKEAKYIIRIVTGNLRLGIADMTVLDALAIAYGGGKEARAPLERAYNISSDLGRVAKIVTEQGLGGVQRFRVILGNPIRPMLAERLGSPEEILEKLNGKCMAEFKYDGERVQAHKKNGGVTLFSRRLENITTQYPDAIELFKEHIRVKNAIVEAEFVAVDENTGELKPFQELMHRRRKYGVKEAMKKHPVSIFIFDLLYADKRDYTLEPYPVRHEKLKHIITQGDRVTTAEFLAVDNVADLERFFEKAVEIGCEGLICKSIAQDSLYQAGARGWMWIKYKREYKSEMSDTVDLVVIGAYHGRGKRAGTYGALLLAAYNRDDGVFETVTKCGTGFTDEDLERIPKMMKKHRVPQKHPRVHSMLDADVWFKPEVVLEVLGSEITLSPIHTCAMNSIREGSGLAIRFPRFTGNYRLDKSAEDSTSNEEITKMYRNQLKKMSES
ncbi:MAG: ATP-dependent DNA ligase [Candidatus Bathyarchaeota archaeon]|nr:MAG: ATP-dependent DNA ligase [Candidatus Bathyarchaeota archaeon]UCH31996.1 MAG: ATP-dependent DNA ligase [Candidatus Bathyarchaeota archaeon]